MAYNCGCANHSGTELPVGEKGNTGATGPQGPRGYRGFQGNTGLPGNDGIGTDAELAALIGAPGSETAEELSTTVARLVTVDSHGAIGDGVVDDTASINAAIATLTSSGSRLLAFSGGRNYKTTGGHVFPVGTTVLVNGATITHTGNNTCFSFNQVGSFNLNKPSGIHKMRLFGNSGVSAVGIESGNSWGFTMQQVTVADYTANAGIVFDNKSNWGEGYSLDGVMLNSNKVGIRYRVTTGTSSFAYTKHKDVSINVGADCIGIDIGGESPSEVYMYHADLNVAVWLYGNNAIGVRIGATTLIDNSRVMVTGEVFGALTGHKALHNMGGTIKAFGHFKVKGATNDLTLGYTRILAASNGVDAATGTDAAAGTFNAWLSSNEDVSHNAMIGHITGTNRSIPFVSSYNQGDIFRGHSVPFNGKPADAGTQKFRIDAGGGYRFGTTETGLLSGDANPNDGTAAAPGSIYLRRAGAAGTAAYIKETGTSTSGWKEIMLARYGTTAERPASQSWGVPYFDSTLGRTIWWDGASGGRWLDGEGVKDAIYTVTNNATMASVDKIVVANGPAVTVSLPAAASAVKGRHYMVKNINAANATVAVNGGANIDGGATVTLGQWAVCRAVSNGTDWYTI